MTGERKSRPAHASQPEAAPAGGTAAAWVARAIVVDDNSEVHHDIRRVLADDMVPATGALADVEARLFGHARKAPERQHFAIDSALKGEEAFSMLKAAQERSEPYALAFVDMRMPGGWDGLQTAERLWEVDPNLQIILCTAFSDYSWEDIVARLGQRDGLFILKKPYEAIEVKQAASALVRKWQLAGSLRKQMAELEATVVERARALEHSNSLLLREVEERRRAEAELLQAATHDSVTGLPNRTLLYDRLSQALARSARSQGNLAVLMLDLDHFKRVNDRYGHDVGDLVLTAVAARLAKSVRSCDTVARVGGDEFVIVLDGLNAPKLAEEITRRLVNALVEPIAVDSRSIRLSGSIGIGWCAAGNASIEHLMRTADLAMYAAKERGRDRFVFWSEDMAMPGHSRDSLIGELRQALVNHEFRLVYQPQFDLESGAVAGIEALLRWQRADGLVQPLQFISVAEESGLICAIGDWALVTACRQARRWQEQGIVTGPMAVNVSARQLRDHAFVETVRQVLAETGLAAASLEIEITESSAVGDLDACIAILRELRAMHVRIVIDDFGLGYSSFQRLTTLPFDALKIDRFFVENMITDPRAAAIVKAVIALCHTLGIQIIAEGIETKEQLDKLTSLSWNGQLPNLRCERAQGFLLGAPMSAGELTSLLSDRSPQAPR